MKKLYFLFLIVLGSQFAIAQTIRYVKQGSAGSGTTWADASGDLQAMINASASGDQVWVAAGTYKPTEKLQQNVYNTTTSVGVATTNRDMAFIMKSGVKLYGGFNGNEVNLTDRNFSTNISILSGDLNNDNIASDGDCYHVVSCRNDVTGAILDGFTIKNGYANGTASVSGSGTDGLSATTIPQNVGAAIAVRGNTTVITYSNLVIQDNYAADAGGAVSLYISGTGVFPFDKVTFKNNTSANEGGALRVYVVSGTPTVNLSNLSFQNNSSTASSGGGLYVYVNSGTPTVNLSASKFIGNAVASRGGAIYALGASSSAYPTLYINSSLFYNNTAASSTVGGGAISLTTGTKCYVINSTFYNNAATNATGAGGAINIGSSASCQLYLYNSIMNGNTSGTGTSDDILKGGAAPSPVIKNSITQLYGTNGLDGNIVNSSPSPLFASTVSTDVNFLALAPGSIALDAGDNSLSTALTDFVGNPRIRNTKIDLGAYEFQVGNYPLPVVLSSFTAIKQSSTAVLAWKTESERNSSKFVIERGSSVDNFKFLKEVAAAGDSNSPLSYSVTDFSPLSGINYYRLVQYDKDGTSEVLGMQSLRFDLAAGVMVYPNPAADYVRVATSSADGIVSLNLISLTGKTVLTNNYAQKTTQESVQLNLANVPKGAYILWINKGKLSEEKQTLLVVK